MIKERMTDITESVQYGRHRYIGNARLLCMKFGSMTDLMRVVEESNDERFKHNRNTVDWIKHDSRHGANWFGRGCHSFKNVIDKLDDGWPEGTKDIRQRADRIIAPFRARVKRSRRILKHTDQGDEIISQAILSGNLDSAWRAKICYPKVQRVEKAEIFLQPSGTAWVTDEELFNQCASALALAFFLNIKRVQTRIVAASYAIDVGTYGRAYRGRFTQREVSVLILVHLKSYSSPLNVEQVAINSWAGVFRTLYFLARCCTPCKVPAGLGSSRDVSNIAHILPRPKNPSIKRYVVPYNRTPKMGEEYIDRLIQKGDL